MIGADRNETRRLFHQAWTRHKAGQPLDALGRMVAGIVADHPEYHAVVEEVSETPDRDFHPDRDGENPFLHMGMHIAIREQVATDRPAGIRAIHRRLDQRLGDTHAAEHAMMECLGRALWEAGRSGGAPDERGYLECLDGL